MHSSTKLIRRIHSNRVWSTNYHDHTREARIKTAGNNNQLEIMKNHSSSRNGGLSAVGHESNTNASMPSSYWYRSSEISDMKYHRVTYHERGSKRRQWECARNTICSLRPLGTIKRTGREVEDTRWRKRRCRDCAERFSDCRR